MDISVVTENHNPPNIALFVTDENLNLWIPLGSSFGLNALFSVRVFKGGCKKHVKMTFLAVMCCIECINQLNGVDGFDYEIGYTKECNGFVSWILNWTSC